MSGGKDIKIGHDKRPISTVSKTDVNLFNYQTGKPLVDEAGNPLVTEQDEFFLSDATAERSTSVIFDNNPSSPYTYSKHSLVGVVTSTYGTDRDVYVGSASSLPVLQVSGNVVGVVTTILQASSYLITIDGHPGISTLSDGNVEVKTANESGGGEKNRFYFGDSIGIQTVTGVKIGDKVTGSNIPDGSFVTRVNRRRLIISNDVNAGVQTSRIRIRRTEDAVFKADNIIRIEEQFKESSEVSRSLLGIDRAETQLSLFSNVSSYGLDPTEFEQFSDSSGISLGEWDRRSNLTYGNHYTSRVDEDTMESAIVLEAFPVPYQFPFGPNFKKLNFYNASLFPLYIDFIKFGNKLYNYFASDVPNYGWGMDWANNFLNPAIVNVDPTGTDIEYRAGITTSFAEVDKWTDTWRNIKENDKFVSPDGNRFDDLAISQLPSLGTVGYDPEKDTTAKTRPGYSATSRKYSSLQSRRVFRYQPGRISGFTFGVKTSAEPVAGYYLEWGITNPTDNYVFHVYGGQISIRRRSTIALDDDSIRRSGLDPLTTELLLDGQSYNTIQPLISHPVDSLSGESKLLYNLDIPREKWNGDRLDGNGISGYQIQMDRVTMWKIEFGWYGAIGARFYAYVPVNNGDARWVVVHTIVIENSLGQPCLEDSYFRLKYILDIYNTSAIKEPAYLYKYGASYYIDGGDEGTQTIFSVNSGIKSTFTQIQKPILGITPKAFITSTEGIDRPNRKLIIPKETHISSDSLSEVQVVTCKACPGFAHAYTPGIASTDTGREVKITLDGSNVISGIGTHYFYETDIGAKLISNGGLYNWYIEEISVPEASAPKKDGYTAHNSATVLGYGPNPFSYPNKHPKVGNRTIESNQVFDRIAGIKTTTPVADPNAGIGGTFGYPMVEDGYPVLLSNYNHQFACNFKFTGAKIEIQFLNPVPRNESNTHASDFYIGLTNKEPIISLGGELEEWSGVNWTQIDGSAGIGNTTILPKNDVLYGEYSHDYAGMDADGNELKEQYWSRGNIAYRMSIDGRIPNPIGGASGRCSKLTYTVLDPSEITAITQVEGNPDPSISDRKFYLVKNPAGARFPTTVNEFDQGQVAVMISGSATATPSKFVGQIKSYTISGGDDDGKKVEYIEINQSLGSDFESGEFSIFVRPIKVEASVVATKTKLYNFSPWPLYLTGNLMDNSAINNITVKETVGNFSRTITPKLYVQAGSIEVTDADGNAGILGEAPPHFKEVTRLSSALYDNQDEQTLRPGIVRDTFYVGANDSQVVDMSKIFNTDRDTITPDNLNLEATFFVAEKIDDGSAGQIEATVIYTEQ